MYVSIIIYYYVYQSESWCFVRETCAGVVTGDGGAGRETFCPPPRNIYCRGELSVPAMVLERNNDARGQGKTRLPACNRLAKKKKKKNPTRIASCDFPVSRFLITKSFRRPRGCVEHNWKPETIDRVFKAASWRLFKFDTTITRTHCVANNSRTLSRRYDKQNVSN